MVSDKIIYVGNVPNGTHSRDLEDIFSKYGGIKNVDIKGRPMRGPVFAFIEFDDSRDAEDAIRGRDGYSFNGCRLRVELSKGPGPRASGDRHRFSRGFRERRRGYEVQVSGLPNGASWQDLKAHCQGTGEILFADVDHRGDGFVEYAYYDDAKNCVKKLDDTKITSHSGDSAYIRMKFRDDDRNRGRDKSSRCSRSPVKRTRSRSPSYSPVKKGRHHSRSLSPRSRSRSLSKSR